MTDILLGPDGDLFIENGQLKLIDSIEVLTRQRLLNKLRTITGTLFTNIDYGIDRNLLFKKGTKDFLDQNIQSLIDNTTGVIRLVEFESSVNLNREYVLTFKYEIETGEIIGIRDLGVSSTGDATIASGIWVDGYWDYSGTYEFTEVWGEEGEEPMVYPESEQVSVPFFLNSYINLTETEKGYDVEFLPGDGPGYFTLYISADTIVGGTYLVSGNLVQGEGSSYLEIYPDDAEDYQNITGRFSVIVKPDGDPIQIYLRHNGIPSPSVLLEDLNIQLISLVILPSDSDGDGVNDEDDAFPNDPNEHVDTDRDGIGNNADTDDDNDGYTDADEVAAGTDPLDENSVPSDNDGDFISDVTDTDDDNDGVADAVDVFPTDPSEAVDTDGDNIGDNADTDDDNDGYSDVDEIAAGSDPLDPNDTPPLYPYELPIINPGAEDGINGWTVIEGSFVATSTYGNHSGDFHFYAGNTPRSKMYQDIVIPSDFFADIDSSLGTLNTSVWLQCGTADKGKVSIGFLNSSSELIVSEQNGQKINTSGAYYTNVTDSFSVPSGTRYVRLYFTSYRSRGSSNDAYADDFSATLELT